MTNQTKIAKNQTQQATKKYHSRYNNSVYGQATEGQSVAYCNALIDDAQAICGAPHFKLSNRKWNKKALAFLSLFE